MTCDSQPTGIVPARARAWRRASRLLSVALAVTVAATLTLGATTSTGAEPTETPTPVPGSPTPDVPTPTATPKPTTAPKPTATPKPTTRPKPAPPTGRIVGRAVDVTGSGIGGASVALFDTQWRWVREVKARHTGRFTLNGVAPGTYILQVSDGRPAWRTDRRAPADTRVRVRAHRDSVRTVTLRRGGFVTGQVTRGRDDRGARRATVRATDTAGRSFSVRADGAGMFALGGLPRGTYQIWGYDAGHRWVGPSVTVKVRGTAHAGHIGLRLRSRAGGVNGFVFEGPELARRTTWVTAVNRRTGQWWVTKARGGDLSFRGLAPGRYTFTLTGTSAYAGRTITPHVRVRPGRTSHVTLRLTQRRP